MDGAGLKRNGTQGIEGNNQGLNGNEAEHVNNHEEGSNSSRAPANPKLKQEKPQLETKKANAGNVTKQVQNNCEEGSNLSLVLANPKMMPEKPQLEAKKANAGNVTKHVQNNCEEGSNLSLALANPKMKQEKLQLETKKANAGNVSKHVQNNCEEGSNLSLVLANPKMMQEKPQLETKKANSGNVTGHVQNNHEEGSNLSIALANPGMMLEKPQLEKKKGVANTGNEAEHVQNNQEEGSSSTRAPGNPGKMPQIPLKTEEANANSKASSSHYSANAIQLSSTNTARPGFYIERATDLLTIMILCAEKTKRTICDLAYLAMDEFISIAYEGHSLWKPLKGHKYEIMDNVEYLNRQCKSTPERLSKMAKMNDQVREFQPSPTNFADALLLGYVPKPKVVARQQVKVEGSRASIHIKTSSDDFVRFLMDVNQWRGTFFNIVSRASFLGIMSNGVEGGYNGRLQVISAEFQLPSPLVPTWECTFARYSKMIPSTNSWIVVDVPLQAIFPSQGGLFWKRPSGCIIKEISKGSCMVTWVENVVTDYSKLNTRLQPFVSSGLAFGVARWFASLCRSIECSETLKAKNIPTVHGTVIPQEGRAGLLNLAGRMMRTFFADINGSSSNQWTQVASLVTSEDYRVRVKNIITDFGRPQATTLLFATSVRIPISPKLLFDFFRCENTRSKWDLLSSKLPTQELVYIIQGNDPRNRVSILHVENKDGVGTFYLQETYIDATGCSYLVYSPVDKFAMSTLLNGGNPNTVTISPSGFAILPDGVSSGDDNGVHSILTMAYYVINGVTTPTPFIVPPQTVALAIKLFDHTVASVKDAIL